MKSGSRFFAIPDDLETKVRLLSVGLEWVFYAHLEAPLGLVETDQVSPGTRLLYDGNTDRKLMVCHDGEEKWLSQEGFDWFGFIVERKFPKFIDLSDVGLFQGPLSRPQAKRITEGLLRKGFVGRFGFHTGYYGGYFDAHGGHYSVILQPWHGEDIFEIYHPHFTDQPARVRLDWEERYGGSEKTVASVAALCQELGLREYVPKGYKAEAA